MRAWPGAALVWLVLAATAATAQDQPPAFLVIEQDALLSGSLFGKDVLAQEERDRRRLLEEGSRLDDAFEAEEQELTEKRKTMDPEAFRALADAFDAKVVATRRDQEQKAIDLNRAADERRRAFLNRVAPVLLEFLDKTGASAVMDRRSVLIAKQDLNITDEVIKRLDEIYRAENPAPGPRQDP